jgi:hypothetical protein
VCVCGYSKPFVLRAATYAFCFFKTILIIFVQLNMWCFDRKSVSGAHKAAFYHPFFVRGQKLACQHISREIFKTQPWSKISNKTTATEQLVPSATLLDARKPSSSTEKIIDTSDDMYGDDFWNESESVSLSTKHKTTAALIPMMSSESIRSDQLGIPNYIDLQCNSNSGGPSNIQMSAVGSSLRIEKLQSHDVSQCPIQSNLAAMKHTAPVSEPTSSTIGIIHHSCDSQVTMLNAGINKPPVVEEGDRGEFEGRPFFFVDME